MMQKNGAAPVSGGARQGGGNWFMQENPASGPRAALKPGRGSSTGAHGWGHPSGQAFADRHEFSSRQTQCEIAASEESRDDDPGGGSDDRTYGKGADGDVRTVRLQELNRVTAVHLIRSSFRPVRWFVRSERTVRNSRRAVLNFW